MTIEAEKTVITREYINNLAEKYYPNLSEPMLVRIALQFEQLQK